MASDLSFPLSDLLSPLTTWLKSLPEEARIDALNQIKEALHALSPFSHQPVDCVKWVKSSLLKENNYNPNVMATAERKLLLHSLLQDGYTQPVVATPQQGNALSLVDGAHRFRAAVKDKTLAKRLGGYIPVVVLTRPDAGRDANIASTVRHNRARGKHQIPAMSALVQELSRYGWDDKHIAEQLGMEPDEVLRLKQTAGLKEMFADRQYSQAWTVE
ncbi:ParB N-terminal domain-containing protein [Atlantibacter hermannii]|uniref:ParB N-terminal domain-containing protein n=1 Tax=Atlantibacter hermannii TaxID=565 RepID=UPI00289B659D|nr:ParB N-terminal domain-containing protein [Atlantibacter hermannii]MDU1952363.1 ParB N-terminal domain-containing protein [Atlantibacter hermannii]MDW4576271.1 ParB N-terminal domain-containing protein [Atlantibacter hermannii]